MPRFPCPHCDRLVEASAEDRGETIRCPHCNRRLQVPAGKAARREEEEEFEERRPRRRKKVEGSSTTSWVVGGLVAVGLAVLLFCGVAGVGFYRLVQKTKTEINRIEAEVEEDRKARTVVVSAADLGQEFRTNPRAAGKKYEDKYLEITGVVERVGKDAEDTPFVILHGGVGKEDLRVECFFDGGDEDDPRVAKLRQGQTITLRGEFGGGVASVRLHDCVLVR
jgi:DNA-directed RNA polymerase subunit RPC12/RpoP